MEKGNRWWDYYYVRYFVGAIFGTIFLTFALNHNGVWHQLEKAFYPEPWPNLPATVVRIFSGGILETIELATALVTVGLAYCYLASTPILLLHGLRDMFGGRESTYKHIARVTQAVTGVGVVLAAFSFSPKTSWTGHWFKFLPYLVVVSIQIWMLCEFAPNRLRTRYKNLAAQRGNKKQSLADDPNWRPEYIESYRHLREHGNALLIIVMEAVLSLALSGAPSPLSCTLLVVAWILPATFAWFLGTWLERLLMT